MLVGNPTTFTRRFLAAGGEVDAGEPTLPTCTLGTAWIYGRPHPLAPPGSLADVSIADRPKIVRFLANIDGRFSGLFRCRDGWVAATDILGCGPLYLRRRIDGYAVATHMGLLAAEGGLSLDPLGSMASILGSLCIAGHTPYAEINRLRAAEYLVFDETFSQVAGRGKYFDMASSFELDRTGRGHPGELIDLLPEAVARDKQADALFLSGGLDSQAIALAIPPSRRSAIRTLSYGGWRSPDRRNGIHVGRSLGYEAVAIGPLKLDLAEYWEPVATLGAGQSGLQASQHVSGARHARPHGECAYSGFLGDALTGHNEKQGRLDGSFVRQIGHADVETHDMLETMAPEQMSAVRKTLEKELFQWQDLPRPRARAIANLHLRQPDFIGSTFDLMHQEIDIATPFFHRELMRYLLTRSHPDIADQHLYRRTLALSGYVAPESGNSALDRHARAVDSRRGRYLTVDWAAVQRRNSRTFEPMIESIEEPFLRAVAKLPDRRPQPLPRWLFALPIAATLQPTLAPPRSGRAIQEDLPT